jgi:diaminopimelate decarboxylase
MADKRVPFTLEHVEKIADAYPTPFHLYDERGIRANARRLKAAFAWNPASRYFAVKACPIRSS